MDPDFGPADVIAEITKLGGKVSVDEKSPGKPVIGVDLSQTRATDKALQHIDRLTQLRSLNLEWTLTTDAGSKHIKGLTSLQSLYLGHAFLDDARLDCLDTLPQLRSWTWKATG